MYFLRRYLSWADKCIVLIKGVAQLFQDLCKEREKKISDFLPIFGYREQSISSFLTWVI